VEREIRPPRAAKWFLAPLPFIENGIIFDRMRELSVAFPVRFAYTLRPMSNEEMEEIKRHFGVVAESLRSDINQIAEGHAVIRHELQSQREEIRDEFNQTRALLRSSFGQLDQRVDTLESDVSSL
jgi:hypothetical protein